MYTKTANVKMIFALARMSNDTHFFLLRNLSENCIPMDVCDINSEDYREFLDKRGALMAVNIRQYYRNLS
jgi:hypothetical protein